MELENFNFAQIFPPCSSNKDVFDACGKKVIEDAMTGYNSTVITYG